MQCGMLLVLFVANVLWLVNAYSLYVYVCCFSLCVYSAMPLCCASLCVLCVYVSIRLVCCVRLSSCCAVPGSLALPLVGSP